MKELSSELSSINSNNRIFEKFVKSLVYRLRMREYRIGEIELSVKSRGKAWMKRAIQR